MSKLLPPDFRLESASARLSLPVRKKLYTQRIAPHTMLGYRRLDGPNGSWSVRCTANGTDYVKKFADADDRTVPGAPKVGLDYYEARQQALHLAAGGADPGDLYSGAGRPRTVDEAIKDYEADLARRGLAAYTAQYLRTKCPPALLARPVSLLHDRELSRWRDGLAKEMQKASANRVIASMKAALNIVMKKDPRIVDRAWRVGLEKFEGADRPRKHALLRDETVHALIDAAYSRSKDFGLLIETLASTGARMSQIARANVGDLHAKGDMPFLNMPKSAKGRNGRAKSMTKERTPIPAPLAALLRDNVAGRPADAPLLMWHGKRWTFGRGANEARREFAATLKAAGVDGKITMYSFRHTSITRMLIRQVPLAIVARIHNTSPEMIQATYSSKILDHADALVRGAFFDHAAPEASNVVAMKR